MAHNPIVAAGRVETWKRKTIKQHLLSCFWDTLSNRSTYNQTVPSAKSRTAPSTVVNKVSAEFESGVYRTTCLWVGRPQSKPIAGPNKAEGKEKKLTTKMLTVYYNVQRFPIVLGDHSVGGDTAKYYSMAEKAADVIKDLFVESAEYDHERAICEGADEWLTESEYWEDAETPSEITTPLAKVMHPNIYMDCTTGKVTWTGTYATDDAAIYAAATGLDLNDLFDIATLDRIHLIASRTMSKLGGFQGNNEVKWVLKISDAQWFQLTSDATANTGFKDLLKYTDKGFNMMMDGHIGVYKNMLIMVSQRQPIYNLENATGARFEYVTSASDERDRAQTTNASTADGTAEIAQLLGNGAICLADISDVDYVRKGFDYDFSQGMTGMRVRGTVRSDLDATVAATSARTNESSFLYFTATTTAVI